MVFEYIIRYSPQRRASHPIAEGFSPTASPAYRINFSITISMPAGKTALGLPTLRCVAGDVLRFRIVLLTHSNRLLSSLQDPRQLSSCIMMKL